MKLDGGLQVLLKHRGASYKVAIFHNNKPIFIIITFVANSIIDKNNKIILIINNSIKIIFIIIYFIINNIINKTTNLKKFIIHKIFIFIINKSIGRNLIFNIIFNNIISYKVVTFYNNMPNYIVITILIIKKNNIFNTN